MNVLQIELIDPRAGKLLADLAEMNLIKIQDLGDIKQRLTMLLQELRSAKDVLTMEEITREVDSVRAKRITGDESSH